MLTITFPSVRILGLNNSRIPVSQAGLSVSGIPPYSSLRCMAYGGLVSTSETEPSGICKIFLLQSPKSTSEFRSMNGAILRAYPCRFCPKMLSNVNDAVSGYRQASQPGVADRQKKVLPWPCPRRHHGFRFL